MVLLNFETLATVHTMSWVIYYFVLGTLFRVTMTSQQYIKF